MSFANSFSRVCRRSSLICRRAFASNTRRPAEQVRIVEVGPRDGLQNEKNIISLETKIELIERLTRTGLRDIEAGAFVAPKWTPQMANSSQILEHILTKPPSAPHPISYSFLLPNMKGFENFLSVSSTSAKSSKTSKNASNDPNAPPTPPPSPQPDSGPSPITSTKDPNEMPSNTSGAGNPSSITPRPTTEVSLFAAATETFSQRNTNCSIAQSLTRFQPILALAKTHSIRVRAYVSVALGCPYEGPNVSPARVAELAASLLEMGADEISVADTTGMGTAPRTLELLRTMSTAGIASKDLAFHFHDTYGQALVNSVVALEHGIRTFDSSVGGLGGCPYSKGATGNVATEDLVYCLHSLGVETGVDVEGVAEIGKWISGELGRENDSRAGKAILARNS
ncbi:MAG: hypothetical protein M1827_005096 [Pycnora praestabilis]|nr:MAG: hypothetical protein M1827_005096 [Pycnora praestabilis]